MSKTTVAILTVISLFAGCLLPGCEENSYSLVVEKEVPEGAFLGDQILLGASDIVEGIADGDEVIFDLSEVPMVRDGTFNDFEVSYPTGTSCDELAWIYSYKDKAWTQIGFQNAPDVGCLDSPSEHFHLISAAGLRASDILGPGRRAKLRLYLPPDNSASVQEALGSPGSPTMRALRLDPDYLTVSLVGREPRYCYGLTFDGEALWVSERRTLLKLSTSGERYGSEAEIYGMVDTPAVDGWRGWE
jgi:hypothetical protein